jgi:ubiquitin carboxyl-terminal hydrolase 4/11
MLVVEIMADGGFIFEEVEEVQAETHLDAGEEEKSLLRNPAEMKFLMIPLSKALKVDSCKGLCGLSNLGNTCFMNSALQCLSNTTELTKYFLYGLYKDEINYKNNLGTQGRLVAAYAQLMKEMWVDSGSKTAPWEVKKSIGKVAQQFSGFAQQDSFELFNYLVDTLHEDLNRVLEKPYVEKADSNDREDPIVA